MKISFTLFVVLIACGALFAQQKDPNVYMFCYFKDNGQDGLHLAYSNDGFKWKALKNDSSVLKPTAGVDKLMRDPCIIKGGDGLYHMVFTVSWNEQGIGYASSKDLVHWSKQEYIPVMANENALNCWAPEVTYDPNKKEYIIYWASTIPGKFASTDSLGDDKYNHRLYYVITKDFKTFTKAKLLYDKGFSAIDATIKEDNGRYIMFVKNETLKPMPEKNIRIATSKSIDKNYSEVSKPINGNYWAEGPTAIKINDKWTVYFDKYMEHKYGAVESLDLINWTDISDKLQMPDGIRHGTVFTISKLELDSIIKAFNN